MYSLQPQYNERLQFVQALALIVALKDHVKFNSKEVARIMKFLKIKSEDQEGLELLPKTYMLEKCVTASGRKLCRKLFNLLAGIGQENQLPQVLLFGQVLQGGLVIEVLHLLRIWKSGDFVAYDYGPQENLLNYNTVIPLIYDLKKVTVPMLLYYGDADALAAAEGVHYLYVHLLESVIAAVRFNHLDFLISSDVKKLVNNRLLSDLKKFLSAQLEYIIER